MSRVYRKPLSSRGWSVHENLGGFVAVGPDIELVAVPASGRAGIREAEIRLNRSMPKQTIELAGSHLLLEGRTGRFVFW
jgi:hypothetical protein